MSNQIFFWGLTHQDFKNSLWNGISEFGALGTGFAAAFAANLVVLNLLNISPRQEREKTVMKLGIATVISIGAGVIASVYAANRLPYVTFAAEKALKFLTITLCGGLTGVFLITFGGMMGYFGRTSLYSDGVMGALLGSASGTFLYLWAKSES
jgi:hypothetical protein